MNKRQKLAMNQMRKSRAQTKARKMVLLMFKTYAKPSGNPYEIG